MHKTHGRAHTHLLSRLPNPHNTEVTALPSRSHTNMTTDTAAPNPTDKPEHHGSCSPARASQFEKARPHQNTTPISTLARRAPSSNLNMWEERIRPQKPQLSPCIPPFKKSIVHEKKGNTLKIPTQVTVCFRRATDSDEASPRRAA